MIYVCIVMKMFKVVLSYRWAAFVSILVYNCFMCINKQMSF